MFIALLLAFALPADAALATMELEISGLRNARGLVHVCVTRSKQYFPNCSGDPAAVRQTVVASVRQLRVSGLGQGPHAVSIFHDENSNRHFDKVLGIPREGFGFSRNPVIRFGAPRFDSVSINLNAGYTRAQLRMQYLL